MISFNSKMSFVAKAAVAAGLLSVVVSQKNIDLLEVVKGSSNSHTFVAATCSCTGNVPAPTAGSDPNNVNNESDGWKWYHGIASCGGMASNNPLNTGTLPPTKFCFLIPVPCVQGIFCCNSIICTGVTWVIIAITGVCCFCCMHAPKVSTGDGGDAHDPHGPHPTGPHGKDPHKKDHSNVMIFVAIGAVLVLGFGYYFFFAGDDDEEESEEEYYRY